MRLPTPLSGFADVRKQKKKGEKGTRPPQAEGGPILSFFCRKAQAMQEASGQSAEHSDRLALAEQPSVLRDVDQQV